MVGQIKRLLAPPVFADDEKTRVAALLNVMLLGGIPIGVVMSILVFFALQKKDPVPVEIPELVVVAFAGLLVLLRYGYVRLACLILPLFGFGVATITMIYFGGI